MKFLFLIVDGFRFAHQSDPDQPILEAGLAWLLFLIGSILLIIVMVGSIAL